MVGLGSTDLVLWISLPWIILSAQVSGDIDLGVSRQEIEIAGSFLVGQFSARLVDRRRQRVDHPGRRVERRAVCTACCGDHDST